MLARVVKVPICSLCIPRRLLTSCQCHSQAKLITANDVAHTTIKTFSTASRLLSAKDYYKILGIPPSSTHADVKQAYLLAVKKHHPDATGNTDRRDNKYFHDITEAYEILSDKHKKLEYDLRFRRQDNLHRLRYTSDVKLWNAKKQQWQDANVRYSSKDHVDEHLGKTNDDYPTTNAEYMTFLYCGLVMLFAAYVIVLFIRY